MSISGFPDNFFEGQYGTCLVRQNASTGVWTFVGWCAQNTTFVDQLAPGQSYTYQIWLVMGNTGNGGVDYVQLIGTSRIAAITNKK